jgi:hypothetical protein
MVPPLGAEREVREDGAFGTNSHPHHVVIDANGDLQRWMI